MPQEVEIVPVTDPAIPKPKASRRDWLGLAVIALPCLLYSMDLTVLNLALPRISADLRTSSAELLWIVDIYGFVLAGLLLPMGALGDRIGRRRLLLIGAAAFASASVLAAFAKTAEALILCRALLGVAGATLAPSTLSLIRNMFLDEKQRSVAVGVWLASCSIGGTMGPLVGGALLDHFWWGSVFLIGVPVMALLLAVGPLVLPEFRDPNVRRIDFASAALSMCAVLLVIYGVKREALADADVWSVVTIAAGLGSGALFVRRQQRLAEPLLDLRLFRNVAFSAALASYTLVTLTTFGIYLFLGQYLQLVKNLSPFESGLATLPVFIGFTGGSLLSPVFARRVPAVSLMIGGLLLSTLGFGVFAFANAATPVWLIAIGGSTYAWGTSPTFTLATDLLLGAAPPERAGAASALSETGSELGGALGVALLGIVGTAIYRHEIARALPRGLDAGVATSAQSTLGGALAAFAPLSEPMRRELGVSARAAFSRSLNATAVLCIALVLLMALGLHLTLGSRRDAGAQD